MSFFVAPTGNDASDGTAGRPWRTIQRAANGAVAGATVFVAPGNYPETIVSGKSGTASARIRFVSTEPWGAKITSAQPVVWRNDGDYVDIVDFDVSGTGAAATGILNMGSNVVVRGNHVHHVPAPGCPGAGAAGIDNGNPNARDSDIIGNVVDNIGEWPASCPRTHGINHSNGRGRIWNNIVFRTVGFGIHTWFAATAVTIANNLVFQNFYGGILVGGSATAADNMVVSNNIVVDNPRSGIQENGSTGPNNRYLNNLTFRNGTDWRLRTGSQSGTITADPQFVNYQPDGTGDYGLSPGSPAIDAGTAVGAPPEDADGIVRPPGAGLNIGPYEGP